MISPITMELENPNRSNRDSQYCFYPACRASNEHRPIRNAKSTLDENHKSRPSLGAAILIYQEPYQVIGKRSPHSAFGQ
jgi:hypothetical protein